MSDQGLTVCNVEAIPSCASMAAINGEQPVIWTSALAQATERLEPGAADEEHLGEIEHDTQVASARFAALALEQIGPLGDDAPLKIQATV
jgi:hypothetical protein